MKSSDGKKKDTIRKLWIGIAILALLSPLGLILPALFGAGTSWGEWSAEELKKLVGYAPEGMRKIAHIWQSPLPQYTVPGQADGFFGQGIGYIFAAIVGIIIAAGLAYIVAKLLERNGKK